MLEYLYTCNYSDEVLGKHRQPLECELHVDVYAAARAFNIPLLAKLALAKFQRAILAEWDSVDFVRALQPLFEPSFVGEEMLNAALDILKAKSVQLFHSGPNAQENRDALTLDANLAAKLVVHLSAATTKAACSSGTELSTALTIRSGVDTGNLVRDGGLNKHASTTGFPGKFFYISTTTGNTSEHLTHRSRRPSLGRFAAPADASRNLGSFGASAESLTPPILTSAQRNAEASQAVDTTRQSQRL